jgi:hypothetical protein
LQTDQLIRGIVADLPTRSGSVAKTLFLGLSLPLLVSLVAMLLFLGPRPEMTTAARSLPFWIKGGYTFMIGTAGLFAVERLGRPGATAASPFAVVVTTVLVVALAGFIEIMTATPGDRAELFLGGSASVCPWMIAALSLPLLAAAILALRQLAPTQHALAGAAAGLMAGGYGACIYSLHCTEYAMSFLATWYSFGILVSVIAGVTLSRLLRW